MIAVYADNSGIEQLIEGHLSDRTHRTAGDRGEFGRMMGNAKIGVVGTLECSAGLVRYLRSTFRLEAAAGPTCIVVTRVSFDNLRSLRDIECDRLRVVWLEELEEKLPLMLNRVTLSRRNPFRSLGPTSRWASSLSPATVRAVEIIRATSSDLSPPPTSVSELAKQVGIDPQKLSNHWKAEMPLRCTLRQMLQWIVLLWAVRRRSEETWTSIAQRADLSPRTLQRYSRRLADCTLKTAARDPAHVRRRFDEWLSEVAAE